MDFTVADLKENLSIVTYCICGFYLIMNRCYIYWTVLDDKFLEDIRVILYIAHRAE
jgi:hypothetical protein